MNKYEIIGIVGEGAYGIVYKAKNKETGAFGKYNSNTLSNTFYYWGFVFLISKIVNIRFY